MITKDQIVFNTDFWTDAEGARMLDSSALTDEVEDVALDWINVYI